MSSITFVGCQKMVLASIFGVVNAMYSSKALEGYPAGFLSDCPNITVPIPKENLKKLSLIVHGAGSSKRIRYNYYQTGLLAKDPYMDWSKKTLVYLPGYMIGPGFIDATAIEAHYIRLGYNVWLLDQFYFNVGVYPTVARIVRNVGAYLGETMAELTDAGLLDPSNVQMIGISLGAHTMSYIAKKYHQLTGRKIGRLTGLDPSGPCFRNSGPEDRLDESDADFVDVVHTSIDGYGMAAPVGHVDFYVNGGESQISDLSFIPCEITCSHTKSFLFWIAAVENQNKFIGVKCDSVQQARLKKCYDNVPQVTNVMGPKTDKSKPGVYYLPTTNSFPYYLGIKGLRTENDNVRMLLKFYQGPLFN